MQEHSHPIEYLIQYALDHGADAFIVNNAKDELGKLQQDKSRWLSCEQELSGIKNSLSVPVAWGRTNDRGDLYDLRTTLNPHADESSVVPLYSNRVEFQNFYSKFKKQV